MFSRPVGPDGDSVAPRLFRDEPLETRPRTVELDEHRFVGLADPEGAVELLFNLCREKTDRRGTNEELNLKNGMWTVGANLEQAKYAGGKLSKLTPPSCWRGVGVVIFRCVCEVPPIELSEDANSSST